MNMAWALLMVYAFPDTPRNAKFPLQSDRSKAINRVRDNQMGVKNNNFKVIKAPECLVDPLTWILVLMQVTAAIPNGGITSVSAVLLVKSAKSRC